MKNGNTEFKVMLAHKTKEINWNDGNTRIIQPKLDGVRCYTRLEADGQIKMYSRNHKEFKNAKHIITQLRPLFAANPGLIIDGELYNHSLRDNFNKIISLVRKQTPSQADKFESASHLQYHVYDSFDNNSPGKLYLDRLEYLKDNLSGKSIKLISYDHVTTDWWMNVCHKENKKNGYEGSMIRINAPYEQKRSWTLQKVKEFHDTEATIIGWVEGQGKRTGTIGKFLAIDENGIEFGMPVMGKQSMLKEMYNIAEWYIGKVATFTYFEKTPRGSYRHPLYKAIRNYE